MPNGSNQLTNQIIITVLATICVRFSIQLERFQVHLAEKSSIMMLMFMLWLHG